MKLATWEAPKHFGTSPLMLKPEDILYVGYIDGSFYVSEFEWRDFGFVLHTAKYQLTWLGSPPWFMYEQIKQVYNWLAERYPMSGGWYPGSFIYLPDWDNPRQLNS